MNRKSFTSSGSFAARAQRSEANRVVIWLVVLVAMLVLTLARRFAGGVVMRDDRVFVPYAGVIVLAILCNGVLFIQLSRANRAGTLLPGWLWRASAVFDLP